MTIRKYTGQTILLIAIAIIAALSLGGITAVGWSNRADSKTIRHVDNNGALSIAQARRTECRAARAAALDKARWDIVFNHLAQQPNATAADLKAASTRGKVLPAIDVLTDKGGRVGEDLFPPCPKSIANRKA